ncbi:MAG TPA: c-type cytochrome [Beijerinckiaceae bacterium]|nr:c-type cytochrome [Beijerinckiaceae bacterium]
MRSTSREQADVKSCSTWRANTCALCAALTAFITANSSMAVTAHHRPEIPSLIQRAQDERSGDPVAGKAAFERQCAICHTTDKGGDNRYGPNLFGIDGRQAATTPGYTYTNAFKTAASWVWEDGSLAGWIAAPGRMVPGTAMGVFPGVADKDRDDIVAYLATLH